MRGASLHWHRKPIGPAKLTKFELELERLGLNPDDLKFLERSEQLKSWARRHRSSCYIPEHLLAAWRLDVFDVDVNLTGSDRPN